MTVEVSELRVGGRVEALAVQGAPVFSWQLVSSERGIVQTAYRIRVHRGDGSDALVWDSGMREGAMPQDTSMPEQALSPGRAYTWSVEVRHNGASDEAAFGDSRFETSPESGLWADARWITLRRDDHQHDDHRPVPYLRRLIAPRERVVRARMHATAGGIYELWAAGEQITPGSLAPGWTDYDTRVAFHTYDLTRLFEAGEPVRIGAVVADGWYAGGVGPFHRRNFWGKRPVWRAVLVLDYEGGDREVVVTDESWEASFGAIQAADLIQGEVVDARRDLGDWTTAAGHGWKAVDIDRGPTGKLVPSPIDAPRPIAELPAVSRHESTAGSFVYDFGQNFAGHVRLRVRGPAGTIVRLRHAEVLDDTGGVYLANLRGARAADTFILSGADDEFAPSFTSHGFRYVEITGLPTPPELDAVTGVAVSSATDDTGALVTDNALVNAIVRNTRWSMRSNFMDVPTDCPARDERVGWTGDGQVFASTACWLADVQNFLSKWVDDILDAVPDSGAVPDIAPAKGLLGRLTYTEDGSSGYAESILIIPWAVYEYYGDTTLIARSYEAGARWVSYVQSRMNDLVWRANRNTDYGDWLAPVETPKDLTATAYFNLAVQLMARSARVLDRHDEARRYEELSARAAAAFRAAFVAPDGTMPAGSQAAYVLALSFDLLLPDQRVSAAEALAADVESRGHLTTGFLSIAHLLPTLSAIGRSDLAYRLMLNEDYPSWGHEIAHGATTIWERWDGWSESGYQDPLMNSFNHYAFGSVTDWLFRVVGGLAPAAPGFGRVRIAPQPGEGVTNSSAEFRSVRGLITVEWRLTDEAFECTLRVPANATAEVVLPALAIAEHGVALEDAPGVSDVVASETATSFVLGSGEYSFRGEVLTHVHA
ncbi:alpha-L-rhamnosidase [Microbacterium sp. MYb66]|uniref:alpha-L-rhamnosidase n=1 Tax=Microbacterium sp. MYb66 TaxID=1848692 RepID=UPI000D004C9B|nr:alpha-L-rhamnosidase [Microbacterium sp. MYb66]PRA78835.1 alpha-L-rhamnosidase [Microbacterium sp. MYb66]